MARDFLLKRQVIFRLLAESKEAAKLVAANLPRSSRLPTHVSKLLIARLAPSRL
jgi:hypothetical protein